MEVPGAILRVIEFDGETYYARFNERTARWTSRISKGDRLVEKAWEAEEARKRRDALEQIPDGR